MARASRSLRISSRTPGEGCSPMPSSAPASTRCRQRLGSDGVAGDVVRWCTSWEMFFKSRSYRCWYFWDACPEYVHALHCIRIHTYIYIIYIYYIYIYICVCVCSWRLNGSINMGIGDLAFVEEIEGGRGYRWTVLVGRQRVDSRCFFQTCWFWIFLSLPWQRKTGRRHQHVLQHATHAKVHVRDMARLVRQVSLTAESINPLETPPYFLAVDQPSLAMDGLASTYICAMWQCWKSWLEPIPQALRPNRAPWGFTAIDSVDCMFGYRVFLGIGWNMLKLRTSR